MCQGAAEEGPVLPYLRGREIGFLPTPGPEVLLYAAILTLLVSRHIC